MLAEDTALLTRPSIMSYVRLGAAVSWGGPVLLPLSSLGHWDMPPGQRLASVMASLDRGAISRQEGSMFPV